MGRYRSPQTMAYPRRTVRKRGRRPPGTRAGSVHRSRRTRSRRIAGDHICGDPQGSGEVRDAPLGVGRWPAHWRRHIDPGLRSGHVVCQAVQVLDQSTAPVDGGRNVVIKEGDPVGLRCSPAGVARRRRPGPCVRTTISGAAVAGRSSSAAASRRSSATTMQAGAGSPSTFATSWASPGRPMVGMTTA